jgi:hypothetical protein
MKTYNLIMGYFWIAVAVISFVVVTYNGFTQGFDRWAGYYIFTLVAVGMYFMKKWMMARMAKHEAFLNEQQNKPNSL